MSTQRSSTIPVMPTVVVIETYKPLFEAALKGDWKATERILVEDRQALTADVMTVERDDFTVLDVAVMAAQDELVENLVKRFSSEHRGPNFKRPLFNAAREGRIRMVKALIKKVDSEHRSRWICRALYYAISYSPMQKEVIWYLARHTMSAPDFSTMSRLIMAGHLDTALYLAHRFPNLMQLEDTRELVRDLPFMKSYYHSGERLNFWERFIYTCIPLCLIDTSFYNSEDTNIAQALLALNRFKIFLWNVATKSAPFIKRIGESKLRHKCSLEYAKLALTELKSCRTTPQILEFLLTTNLVLKAASRGASDIVKLFLERFPELMWEKNFTKELLKDVVKERHVELFRLLNAHNRIPESNDEVLRNHGLMEAVVQLPPRCLPTDVSGAAFLMQRELQWFKVLEDRSDPSLKSMKLLDGGKTYWEGFVEGHQNLLKDAGAWVKDTSTSCSFVATLITTVVFAAAFTVPGGNNSNTGIPIFMKKDTFMIFAIADALALFSSVSATLMFLAILTSCYAIEDFLNSLPRKMILGLTFLFLSLAFMLVAFGSALMIVLSEHLKWIFIPIILLAAFPIVLFTILQLPLYVEMVESTFWPRLYRPLKLWK